MSLLSLDSITTELPLLVFEQFTLLNQPPVIVIPLFLVALWNIVSFDIEVDPCLRALPERSHKGVVCSKQAVMHLLLFSRFY